MITTTTFTGQDRDSSSSVSPQNEDPSLAPTLQLTGPSQSSPYASLDSEPASLQSSPIPPCNLGSSRLPTVCAFGGCPTEDDQDPLARSRTPDLGTDDDPECFAALSASGGPKLFPIFRPKAQRKMLHCVRHGQSTFNAATNTMASFADPDIFDAALTLLGRRQASAAREVLQKLRGLQDALWVVSPLQRTIETFLLACPYSDALGVYSSSGGSGGGGGGSGGIAPAGMRGGSSICKGQGHVWSGTSCSGGRRRLNVVVHPDVAEHCATSGDVGRPASVLRQQFPQLESAMCDLPERWWYRPEVNDTERAVFSKGEPKQRMKERVKAFSRWVDARPEKIIVLVGHSTYLRELTGMKSRLKNGELHTQHF